MKVHNDPQTDTLTITLRADAPELFTSQRRALEADEAEPMA